MSDSAARMMRLFGGYRGAHGTHGAMSRNESKGGKLEIRKSAKTLREPVTEELWQRHLDGEYFLGIIPIDEDGNCQFGCIDVDRYDIDLGEIARELERRGLPMVVCRSKSGGAHVYLFLARPTPAPDLRRKLKHIAASMGWGDCEIFPKQNQFLAERGDLANWLNMPYQNASKPDRYAVKKTMAAMSLSEFLTRAESLRVDLDTDLGKMEEPADDSLSDGPPCLQHLCEVGFPEGQRNNGFFALATFCKKKYGSKWKEMLEEYNRRYFSPPRPADEVADVMKRIGDKDYNYRCTDVPLCNFCNVTLCRQRKFGVGGGGEYPVLSGLSKLDSDPPLWFVDIEDTRVELTTDQLQNYRFFQKACMEQITTMFMPVTQGDWAMMVGDVMQNALIIEAAPEMSTEGYFRELLEEFCTNRHRGRQREDLQLGKPWEDEEVGRHYFRLTDLMDFLDRNGFRTWGRNKIGEVCRTMGGDAQFNFRGTCVRAFWVASEYFAGHQQPDLPEVEEDPI